MSVNFFDPHAPYAPPAPFATRYAETPYLGEIAAVMAHELNNPASATKRGASLQLQELSRLDHPLLQELLRRAPGTYHHSIMVANLAEISDKVNRGEGTVGALINDRAVADGLEDVVAGIRTPDAINDACKTETNAHLPTLEEAMPAAYES